MEQDDRQARESQAEEATAGAAKGGRFDRGGMEDGAVTDADITADLENLRLDLSKANDRHLRLAAEFDNYRKRIERERTELYARAQADLAQRLLDVIDDLERVAHYGEDTPVASLLQGVQLVEKKLHNVLESLGLEKIDPKGAVFDPGTMEGLATVEAAHPEEDDVVADVFQKGYRFKDQLIRPARVRVKRYEA